AVVVIFGAARQQKAAIAAGSSTGNCAGIDADHVDATPQQFLHRGQPRSAKSYDTDLGLRIAVKRREAEGGSGFPARSVSAVQLIPTLPVSDSISLPGS